MNPNRHQAVEIRIRALSDQIEGLLMAVASGHDEAHVERRLWDTRVELQGLAAGPVTSPQRRVPQ